MSDLRARIKKLHDEKRKQLRFAEQLEKLLAARRAAARPITYGSPGPRFAKVNPYSEQAQFSVATSRAYSLLEEVATLVRAANIQGCDDAEGRRSYMLACRILGLSWVSIHKAVADVSNYGVTDAAKAWARYLGPTDKRIVGQVYVAVCDGRPDIIKIGFSQNPAKRAKALTRQQGSIVEIIHEEGGTMLHEWAIHQFLFLSSVAPEWYRASEVPAWLFPVEFGGSA